MCLARICLTAAAIQLAAVAQAQAPHAAPSASPPAAPSKAPDASKIDGVSSTSPEGTSVQSDRGRVRNQINFGFKQDLRAPAPFEHSIKEEGISVPKCFSQSRESQACQ